MSADTEEVTPPPDDTEEVTPPPDVTLGEEPQNEDQSSSSSCSCCSSCCCFPTRWRNSFPFFRRRSPDSSRSLDTSSDEDSSQWEGALMSIGSMDQPTSSRVPQGLDSWDPGPEPVSPPESDFPADIYATRWSNESMDPPPPLSGQQNPDSVKRPPWGSIEQRLNPEFPLYLWSSLNMESPERLGASKRRSQGRRRDRSMDYTWIGASMSISPMEPPTSSRVPLGPDSLDPGPEPVSQPEPDFTADISSGGMEKLLLQFKPQQIPPFDFHRSNASMDPPPSFSRPQNPDCSRSLCCLLNVDSPERLGASMWSTRSMDPPISFRAEPDGVRWLRPGLKKYLCELVPDTDTMNKNLQLSHDGRTVTYEDEVQKYPDHPHRFHQRPQLLCRNALTGRCYWEVDWTGIINIAVSSRGISREGDAEDCWFGRNDQSWSLYCSDRHGCTVTHKERPICSRGHFLAYHDNNPTTCSTTSSEDSNRAAVYVDVPAGTLSFFVVSGDELIHLHTFHTTSTEPLYPGFGFWGGSGASVSLPSV